MLVEKFLMNFKVTNFITKEWAAILTYCPQKFVILVMCIKVETIHIDIVDLFVEQFQMFGNSSKYAHLIGN